ncbi:TrlF family AAA-like ATPase [Photobacterium damselae]|uniref:TrlF family AAA-like ATPase n=1 Tax=Photobacterium damselae TaxID=38293 RepID=UPI00370BC9A0
MTNETMNNIVGSRWWKFDFHAHSPASLDYKQKDVSPRDWLLGHIAHGIECIAVTDHNTSGWIDCLKQEAQQLRDEGHTIHLFPGVEISTQGNVHVLAIFDPSADAQHVATAIGAAGYTGTYGDSDTDGSQSPEHVVKTITENLNGVAIPAHIELEGSGVCKLGSKSVLRVCKAADAVEVVFPDKPQMSTFRSTGLSLPQIIGSDSHAPNENGRAYTWVKMSSPTIDGLKLALLDGNTCIRRSDEDFTPNTLPLSYLKELTVSNTKYCGRGKPFSVKFNPWLNSIVGSRGSGKSTLAEFIRIALNKTGDILHLDEANEIRRNFERFFKVAQDRNDYGVLLNNSQVECVVAKNNIDYKISWGQDQQATIYREENGQWLPELGDIQTRFPVSIYSQKQIFDMAKDPNTLLAIIDNSSEVDFRAWQTHWDELKNQFTQLRTAELGFLSKVGNLNTLKGQISDVNAKIAHIEASGHAQILQNYNGLYNQKNYASGAIAHMSNDLQTITNSIQNSIGFASTNIIDQVKSDPVLAQSLQQAAQKIEHWKLNATKELEKITSELMSLGQNVENSNLSQLCNDAYSKYSQLVTSMQQQGIKEPSEYNILVKERIALNTKVTDIAAAEQQLATTREEIGKSYQSLIAWRKELTKRRENFVNKYISPHQDLKIKIGQLQHSEHLEQSFRELINRVDNAFTSDLMDEDKKQGILYALRTQISQKNASEADSCYELLHTFKLDVFNHRTSKANIFGCTIGKRFSSVIEQLDNSSLDKLWTWFPEDNLSVEFHDGRRFKPLSQGSAGQKAAAVLSFLLSYGDEPLIVDQPEDDLDNALISKLVITKLHDIKPKRQFLIITHNPNIVVNGDSELVIVLEDKGNITLSATGGLQELSVRQEVCEIMEGGKEALEKRYKRMKYNS